MTSTEPAHLSDSSISPHLSVLYHETIRALQPKSPGRYVDGTVGAGGHAHGILEKCTPDGQLLGLDLDPQALRIARQHLSQFSSRTTLVQSSYTNLQDQLEEHDWEAVEGILLDLGVSSMQLDTADRGFSFREDGPLDMRFGPLQKRTAADLVNKLPVDQLADLIWRYGEESQSRRIAREICRKRPLHTTYGLSEVIQKAARISNKGNRKSHQRPSIHPATLTFQALRIAVNEELQALEIFLPQAVKVLSPGGRLAIISFHSLEDRIVKQFFRRESRDCICPPEQPVCTCDHKASLILNTRRAVFASEEEKQNNPRARSARLRFAEKKTGP
jgi:16S rRNA (cytosine1402-N4)-methyltransferase